MNLLRKKTTDLLTVYKYPDSFTWGPVIQFHKIGPYTILEHRTVPDDGHVYYHVYVGGQDTHRSAATLEGAILIAIAKKHLDLNQADHMAAAACKILEIKE